MITVSICWLYLLVWQILRQGGEPGEQSQPAMNVLSTLSILPAFLAREAVWQMSSVIAPLVL